MNRGKIVSMYAGLKTVQTIRVLDPDSLLYSMGPHQKGDSYENMINGFNSRCLHVITGQDYRDTATTPVYDLVLAVRQRRMRYLGHVLRMPPDRIVRRALVALVKGGTCYPEGSLFDHCGVASLRELVDTAKDRSA